MVKSDVRRDYYADLGLAPSAESEDIKRQFRKLALKFHPDRNPGRELEFNAKFQAIQAANEILSDPQQRLKYDTDRLRAGYGKFYGPKSNTPRKAPTNPYTSTTSPKPQQKPFPGRTPFHNGPSTGAQRYASYARAAPQQSWQKKQDDGQTRADAYRGFQDMKGNSNTGWAYFDPRTGHFTTGMHYSNPPTGQRPKSAFEYFKTSPKTATPDSAPQSAKKKGFTPHTAGGDEPMAPNTSSYSNVHRNERFPRASVYEAAPSPTARKSAAAFGNRRAPDLERTSSKYASTGGEKTFFSSAGLGRSPTMHNSPGSPRPHSRTNPQSPTSPRNGRYRSASPQTKNRNRAFSSSSSSSDTEDDFHSSRKPKAVPKSRLRRDQKFSDFHQQENPGTGEHSSQSSHGSPPSFWTRGRPRNRRPRSFQEYMDSIADREYVKGHDSDSAASPRNGFGKNQFGMKGPFTTSNGDQNGTFKSSSHGNLRTEFSAQEWQGAFRQGHEFFIPTPSDKDTPRTSQSRGRSAAPNGTAQTGQSGTSSGQGSPRSASISEKPAFGDGKFSADEWVEQFKNLSWVTPNEGTKQGNSQSKSPKKPTRAAKTRPTPQPASVATEAEESKATVDGSDKGADGDVEAMDLDEAPGGTGAKKATGKRGPSKSRPSSSEGKGKEAKSKSHLFNLKEFGNTAPFREATGGGINDLQDIHATLPFESRAKNLRTTVQDVRPRELNCPNPPRRPRRPVLVPVSIGSQQLALPKAAWDRYVAEMTTYMREWNDFNKKFLLHFATRQDAIETGLAPNWISSVGDSAKIKLDGDDADGDSRDESDDDLVSGSSKGGYSAYLRGLEEDVQVRKHWEVACELHRECILELGQLRGWILDGGKVV